MRLNACLTVALRLGRVLVAVLACCVGMRATARENDTASALATYVPAPSEREELDEFGNPSAPDAQVADQVDNANGDDNKSDEPDCKLFTIHAQSTIITNLHGPFRSPYVGQNSLLPIYEDPTSQTSTLFLGTRLWDTAELYFNPEVAGGRGFSSVTGLAGFTNGEITRVGKPQPTPYIARLFFAKTYNLGGEEEKVADDFNQVAGYRDVNRLTVRVGKMAFTDYFDNNAYSHDPRTQFMNWSMMYNGAWDFPANVRGYTYGGVIDFNHETWALRYGLFAEPTVANGADLDPRFGKAHGQSLELENRYKLWGRPGALRSMVYVNNAHMGNYKEATDDPIFGLDIAKTRRYSTKTGLAINIQQELTDNAGFFLRWGWNDGQNETWAFTEIDRTISLGLLVQGAKWGRQQDQVGLGLVVNGISAAHRNYLAAGGYGFIIGDGRLNYGFENIYETYYRWQITKNIFCTGNLQFIDNPAYNRDRGPVVAEAIRVHAEF